MVVRWLRPCLASAHTFALYLDTSAASLLDLHRKWELVSFDSVVPSQDAAITSAMALIKGPDMYTLGVAFFAAIGTFLFGG
jgi:hypothetical protein